MQALKVILAVFLGILLFVSLVFVGVMVTLNQTVLDAEFVVRQIDRLDISAVVSEVVTDDLLTVVTGGDLPVEADFLVPVLLATLDREEPWVKAQAAAVVNEVYDYVQGRSGTLALSVNFGDVRDTLEENLTTALINDPPAVLLQLAPQWAEMPLAERQAALAQLIPTLMSQIPESMDLVGLVPDAVTALTEARGYMGYVILALWGGIGVAVLLALLIVLVFRSVRGSCVTLGTVFLIYAAGMLVIRFAVDITMLPVLSPYLMMTGAFPSLHEWAVALLYDVIRPTLWLGVGFVVAGLVLVAGGALARPRDDY
jgi:hypothetical protein